MGGKEMKGAGREGDGEKGGKGGGKGRGPGKWKRVGEGGRMGGQGVGRPGEGRGTIGPVCTHSKATKELW